MDRHLRSLRCRSRRDGLVAALLCATVAALYLKAPLASALRFDSRLLADVADVRHDFGLVVNDANTVAPVDSDSHLKPPPGDYKSGAMVLALFSSTEHPGTYEVYTANTTGNIPVLESDALEDHGEKSENDLGVCLFRWTTSDFSSYAGGECTVWVDKSGLSDIKTITRDDASGTYFMVFWGHGSRGGVANLYTSTDNGKSWKGPQSTSGLQIKNGDLNTKDDINFVYQPGVGLVNLQIFWQKNKPIPGGFCDNGNCDQRRVIGSMVSEDKSGLKWKFTGSTRIPGSDENDPPELQFYRIRPFVVPGTGGARIFAHALLYAPSPYINKKYGRQPPMCNSDAPTHCHGPHMYEEWWTLARGESAANLSGTSWRRPDRFTKMAPENAYLFAQPGIVSDGASTSMIWIGSGQVYTLPLHRGVGLYAPANARVTVQPPFDLTHATDATQLWINADAHWGPALPAGGCDETCAAYVLAELEDANGKVIDGYDRNSFEPIMNMDAINLPLRWNNSPKLPAHHGNVSVKIWFRAARIYAVYLGDSFEPGF